MNEMVNPGGAKTGGCMGFVSETTPCNVGEHVKSWKSAERRIAAILGGERVPVSGRGREDSPDIEHPILSVEVKSRASIPR